MAEMRRRQSGSRRRRGDRVLGLARHSQNKLPRRPQSPDHEPSFGSGEQCYGFRAMYIPAPRRASLKIEPGGSVDRDGCCCPAMKDTPIRSPLAGVRGAFWLKAGRWVVSVRGDAPTPRIGAYQGDFDEARSEATGAAASASKPGTPSRVM